MRLSYKALKKYTVRTLSGMVLGRVRDVIVDTESQSVLQYEVSRTGIGDPLLIHCSQVVRFEDQEMIVEDTLAEEKDHAESAQPLPGTRPVFMREQ
jgi:sporulation protein YlmC with PRC-barrel domain